MLAGATGLMLARCVSVGFGCLQVHHTNTEDWVGREKFKAVEGPEFGDSRNRS